MMIVANLQQFNLTIDDFYQSILVKQCLNGSATIPGHCLGRFVRTRLMPIFTKPSQAELALGVEDSFKVANNSVRSVGMCGDNWNAALSVLRHGYVMLIDSSALFVHVPKAFMQGIYDIPLTLNHHVLESTCCCTHGLSPSAVVDGGAVARHLTKA